MIGGAGDAFVPGWTTSGAAIGNGTLTGSYAQIGNMVTLTFTFAAGSTTNFGTGTFVFTIPLTAAAVATGTARIQDASTNFRAAAVVLSGNQITLQTDAATSPVSGTVPFVWASGDKIDFSITFRV